MSFLRLSWNTEGILVQPLVSQKDHRLEVKNLSCNALLTK